MKNLKMMFFCCACFLLTMCNTAKKVTPTNSSNEEPVSESKAINFETNTNMTLSQVLEKAKKEQKIIFLDAYATWCAPCKVMDKEVFTNQNLANYLNQHCISYKVNVEKNTGPTVALLYEVSVLPTLLFLDAEGNVIERSNNSMSLSELMRMAKKAVEK